MENNKYYTPSIEEFHVGFEYEKNEPHRLYYRENAPVEYKWCNKKWDDNQERLGKLKCSIYDKNIRVKYLDQNDIEGLGFTLKGRSIDLWFEKTGICLRDDGHHLNNIKIQYGLHDHRLLITFNYVSGEEQIHFDGIIKNKSELIKLLKQLSYF